MATSVAMPYVAPEPLSATEILEKQEHLDTLVGQAKREILGLKDDIESGLVSCSLCFSTEHNELCTSSGWLYANEGSWLDLERS
jgi:hypothetical protein